ncbi:MAG: TonB-dependent receptor [Acidobacteriota bacterium]|nr:TonB-dependent receptor [Acidobacteriota bacterium]
MRSLRLQSAVLALIFLLSSFLAIHPAAWGQATSGDVVGTVLDRSGAAIPNASVSAVNVATGVTATVTTNTVGDFRFSNLLAGTYNISGSAPGFSTFTLRNFQVLLNTTSTARLVLPVATAATSVEVSSEAAAMIDTTTTQLQTTFQTEELKNLPTASTGLGVLNLTLLVPGVASAGAIGAGTGPTVSGLRPEDNNYTIEGIDNNNKSVTGPLVYVPNDAVGEFTAITTQFSPEFGHSAGGQFNTIVRGGTNKIHGEAYEYFQNRNLNAENAIEGGKVPNPRYDNNRYGGQVGGPIVKNKLFYFANFERNTVGQSGQYYVCTPTAAGMTALGNPNLNFSATNLGIFTKYTPVSPSQVDAKADNACFNQTTGGQYLTVYDGTNFNSTSGIFGSGTAYTIPLGNYLIEAPNYSNFDVLTTSADYTMSSKDSFRGRYIYNKYTGIDTAAGLPAFYQPIPSRFHLIAVSEYHNFTPGLNNEARLGFNRYYNATPSGNFSFPGLDSFPTMYLYDSGFLSIGPDGNAPQSTVQNMYQVTDNLSWVKGRHSFKFGFDGRKFISPQSFTQRVRGDYEWNAATEYLHDLAPTAFGERSTGNFNYYGDQTAFYGYFNDTWRLTDKLSLNYGLRYEFTSVPVGERTQALNAAASVPGLIVFSKPKPQYKNFLPRVGVNYAVNPDTSIRAGFGMAVDVLFDNLGILSFPPQYFSTNDVGSGSSPAVGSPNFLKNGGLPAGTGSLATFATIADQRAATASYVPDQKLPYAENWTLGVQHVFAKNYTFEARYVGTHGVHLPTQIQLNVAPRVTAENQLATYLQAPSAAALTTLTNTLAAIQSKSIFLDAYRQAGFTSKITSFQPYSSSNYNGMAASLNRQFTNGLLLNLSYTWSKAMDDATAAVFSTVLTPRRPQNSQNVKADYSRSALDHTHRLTMVVVYDLPFFKQGNWMAKNLLGNWEVAPIYTYESPEYYTVLSGVNSNQNGDSTAIDRTIFNKNGVKHTGTGVKAYANPNLAGSCAANSPTDPNGTLLCKADTVAYVAINPNAEYITAGAGTLPTASRNTEPINPINNLDVTAIKRFNLGETRSIEFQAQAYNVLNHAQYMPGTIDNVNSPGYTNQILFQTAGNAAFNQPGKFFLANARTMQLALKFSF